MSAPDFLVIGAMKCGTSTLAAQLTAQAGVFMTTPKEPNYFSDDDIFALGPQWYADLFAGAARGALKGEASTHYTKLPTYPHTCARMQAALPEVRLVYMIRNPMVRAVSHYVHEWTERRASADANAAFHSEPTFVDYGCYGMQIAPFVDAFGVDNILLTSLEAIKDSPESEFAKIAGFLNLPEGARWQHDLKAQNVSTERMRRLPMQGLLIDNPVAAALRRTLVPKSLRQRIRATRQMDSRPDIPADLRGEMEARFLQDRAVLGRFFPDHPALVACYPFAPS